MAAKEATVYIVDVGLSMDRKRNGREKTDLEWALEYVWDRITATVATERKTAHVGVIALRTNGTANDMDEEEYSNITVLQDLKQTLMPDLRELRRQLKASYTEEGDAISALVIAVHMISTHCKKLMYIRRIILITNGLGPIDASDVGGIAEKIKEDGMELLVLGVDFDDPEYGFKEEAKSDTKAENEAALRALVEDCDGAYGTLAQAIEELGVPRIKTVRPVASYKGHLTLGDPERFDSAMVIDIERYPKTMVAKPPTASNFVVKTDMAPGETGAAGDTDQSDGLAAVKRSRTYQVADESAPGGKRDVEEEFLEKGYTYGSTAVHIAESDRNVTTFETKPGLDIIGFVAKEEYEPYMDMSRANVIVASRSNDKAVLGLSSFIHALLELNSYAVARFVPKPDKAPVILLLRPSISSDIECLYDVELPFAEDIRQYRFPPLDRILTVSGKTITQHRNLPTSALQDAMSAYVDAMDLSRAGADEGEYAPIDESYSPVLHRVAQAIRHRAVHPDAPLPPPAPALTAHSHPPARLTAAAADAISALSAAAELKRVPPKAVARRKRDGPKPLSGLDVNALLAASRPAAAAGGGGAGLDARNAVPEFRQRLQTADSIAAVHAALKAMGDVVRELVRGSTGDAGYARALEGLRVMREEMVELEDAGAWNGFLQGFKKELFAGDLGSERGDMWFEIRAAKLGLIQAGECEGGVGEEEARAFLAARRVES